MSLLLILCLALSQRSKPLLISWLQSPSAVIWESKKRKSVTVYTFSPFICHEALMILGFRMLSCKPAFSLSSYTLNERLVSSSWLSAIRVVSSVYLRLLIFLTAILIPACDSSSLAFPMMFSAYKLNKQGDNIQPWWTLFPIWNQSIVPYLGLTVASWPVDWFLRRQIRWSGIPISLRIFHSSLWSTWSKALCSQWSRCFSGILWLTPWSNKCWQFDLWFLCLF